MALVSFAMGDRRGANRTIDEILKLEPKSAAALTLKARLLLADEKPDEALAIVNTALQINPSLPDAYLARGRAYLALRDSEEAQKQFREALKLKPGSLPALLELTQLHLDRREIDSALQFADQAVTSHKGSITARIALVRALLIRKEDRLRADEEMRSLLQRFPRQAPTYNVLGAVFLSKGDRPGATKSFEQALQLDPNSMEALAGLVALDIAAQKPEAAQARVEAALAIKKDAPTLLLAANVYGLTGQASRIESVLHDALKADADNPQTYALLAQFYVSESRLDDARKQFLEIARLEPKSVVAPTMLGLLSYLQRDRAEARRWWEAALRLEPRAAAAANNLAWLLAEDGGDVDGALQLAQIAKAKYPDAPEINDTLGWVYYRKGLTEQALTYLSQSIEKDPANPTYHYHLGMTYAQRGDDGKARRALERALALDPRFEGAADARKTLSTLVF
jgi:tetratricopeptide (TPR) repeat protein